MGYFNNLWSTAKLWLFVIGANTYCALSTNVGVLYSALTLTLTPSEIHDVTSVSASARVRCRGNSTLWMRPSHSTDTDTPRQAET